MSRTIPITVATAIATTVTTSLAIVGENGSREQGSAKEGGGQGLCQG